MEIRPFFVLRTKVPASEDGRYVAAEDERLETFFKTR
jgi:hypothetical protein